MPCLPLKACLKAPRTRRNTCGAGSLIRHSGGTPRLRAGSTQLTPVTLRAQDALNCSVPSGPRFLVVGPRGVPPSPGPFLYPTPKFYHIFIVKYTLIDRAVIVKCEKGKRS